jgi:hypothetical protein
MGVTSKLGDMGVVTLRLEDAINWARTRAMWPMLFGLACCAIEMMSTQASLYDLSRFDDCGRPGNAQNGPRAAAALRPDAGTEMGPQYGRLRVMWRRIQQLCHRAGRG